MQLIDCEKIAGIEINDEKKGPSRILRAFGKSEASKIIQFKSLKDFDSFVSQLKTFRKAFLNCPSGDTVVF